MASRIATTIDLSGPFFQYDPAKRFVANVRTLMEAVAKEGQEDVQAQLRSGEGNRAAVSVGGRVSDRVYGRVDALNGKDWHYNAVVSINTTGLSREQAIAYQAAGSRLESRLHAFRRTANRMRRARALNTVELLKGLT